MYAQGNRQEEEIKYKPNKNLAKVLEPNLNDFSLVDECGRASVALLFWKQSLSCHVQRFLHHQ